MPALLAPAIIVGGIVSGYYTATEAGVAACVYGLFVGTFVYRELGWKPRETFETGLRKTVQWYLDNPKWWGDIRSGRYRGERLGALVS